MVAPPQLLRGLPLLRFRVPRHRLLRELLAPPHPRRQWCSATEFIHQDDVTSASKAAEELSIKIQPKHQRWDDPDYRRWKVREEKILGDIDPVILLAKEILHSDKYMDGQQLTAEDEKVIIEKLLAYHPHSEDKIGCGLDYVMVDRHPEFRNSRCLFVVRRDGGWIDFSYQKCIRQYIRKKYPADSTRFIREHFKRCRHGVVG